MFQTNLTRFPHVPVGLRSSSSVGLMCVERGTTDHSTLGARLTQGPSRVSSLPSFPDYDQAQDCLEVQMYHLPYQAICTYFFSDSTLHSILVTLNLERFRKTVLTGHLPYFPTNLNSVLSHTIKHGRCWN